MKLKEIDMRKILVISTICVLFLSAGIVYGAPIHDAAQKGDYNTVERLLKSGVPVDTKNNFGKTPLFITCDYPTGTIGVARLLLKWGANPNIVDSQGSNPTDAAKFNGKTEMLNLLMKHGGKYHRKAPWNP
jgi:uncharacterized protein